MAKTRVIGIEEDDNHKPLDNVSFYGISAKRYCLYDSKDNGIRIRKYSTHGLGHLLNIEDEQVWKSILTNNFSGYSDRIATSQIKKGLFIFRAPEGLPKCLP